jgi:hypothetical protein
VKICEVTLQVPVKAVCLPTRDGNAGNALQPAMARESKSAGVKYMMKAVKQRLGNRNMSNTLALGMAREEGALRFKYGRADKKFYTELLLYMRPAIMPREL